MSLEPRRNGTSCDLLRSQLHRPHRTLKGETIGGTFGTPWTAASPQCAFRSHRWPHARRCHRRRGIATTHHAERQPRLDYADHNLRRAARYQSRTTVTRLPRRRARVQLLKSVQRLRKDAIPQRSGAPKKDAKAHARAAIADRRRPSRSAGGLSGARKRRNSRMASIATNGWRRWTRMSRRRSARHRSPTSGPVKSSSCCGRCGRREENRSPRAATRRRGLRFRYHARTARQG